MSEPPRPPRPTDAELAILTELWRRGPSTVRQIHEALHPTRGTGYTTVLKLMQIMVDKGMLAREEDQRSHVYRPLLEQRATQRTLVGELIDKAFAGSASELVQSALSTKPAKASELAEIRALLDNIERRRAR
jgi:predicted transcriptional regulator